MKLPKEIAEEQERNGVAYMDDLCACFDRGVAEKIIAARLEPVEKHLRDALERALAGQGIAARGSIYQALALLSEEE